jgi:hypothetical protein
MMWRSRGFKDGQISIAGAPVDVRDYLITTPQLTDAQIAHLTRSSAWTLITEEEEAPPAPDITPAPAPAQALAPVAGGDTSPEPAPKRRGRPKKVSP